MSKVTVLGGGGWAIALAKVLNENGHNVTLWSALESYRPDCLFIYITHDTQFAAAHGHQDYE